MNFFKRLGINYVVDAIICVAVGLILLFLPGVTMTILCKALAVLLIVAGAAMIISYLINKDNSIGYSAMFAVGLLIAIIGVWIFMKPDVFISLIPLIAGVIIVINGVTNFAQAISPGQSILWKMVACTCFCSHNHRPWCISDFQTAQCGRAGSQNHRRHSGI